MGEKVSSLGADAELQRRLKVHGQIETAREKGIHLPDDEIQALFTLHGVPLHPVFEPQGRIPESTERKIRESMQPEGYYSFVGERFGYEGKPELVPVRAVFKIRK